MPSDQEEGANKRQRVSRACDLCRRKKIKCDGLMPVCSNCKAFDLDCTYKDTTKKRGPPKGYIEAIENRLYKLENLLSEMAQGDDPKAQSLLAELNTPLETPSGEQIFEKPQRRSTHHSDRSRMFFWQNPSVRPKASFSSESPQRDDCILDNPIGQSISLPSFPSSSSPSSSSPSSIASAANGTKSRLSPIASILRGVEASDSTGQLAMDANGQYRYLGKSSGFYLLQKSRSYHHGAFHLSGNQKSAPMYNSSSSFSSSSSPLSSSASSVSSYISPMIGDRPPLSVDPFELPPPSLSTTLVKLYFRYFYPMLPIFYKQQLSSSLDDPAELISPLLLNAIYAVASRICDDVQVRSDPARPETAGEIFFERAKCLLNSYYDVPRISTVQALLLLSSHQQGTMKSARAWLYSGMAFRMALDLGLNRNCDHWQIPADEKERRKRVFWCCFVVDRLASATYGRSSTFEESDCDIPFPVTDDDQPVFTPNTHPMQPPPPGPLVVLSHLVKICDILGHVLKNIYYAKALAHSDMRHISQLVFSLTGRLSHWYKNLPPSLRMEIDGDGSLLQDINYPICVSQLHMVYHTAVILLHRLFIPNNAADVSPESISEYNTCAASATAIMNIANNMLQHNVLRYVFHSVVYFVFTSGIIFINSASSNDAAKSFDAKVNINNIMRLLDALEKTWTSASRSSNILGELAGLRELNLPTRENTLRPIVFRKNLSSSSPTSSSSSSPSAIPSSSVLSNDTGLSLTAPTATSSSLPSSASSLDVMQYDAIKHRPRAGIDKQKQWSQHSIMMGSLSGELDTRNTNFTQQSSTQGSIVKRQSPQLQQQQISSFGKGNMDPFAAPDSIPTPSQRQFDLSGAAFWGVPPSLDLDEWSHYLGTQLPTYQQQQQQQGQEQQQPIGPMGAPSSPSTLAPSLSSPLATSVTQQQSQVPPSSMSSSSQPHLIPSRNIIAQFNPVLKSPTMPGTFTSMIHSASGNAAGGISNNRNDSTPSPAVVTTQPSPSSISMSTFSNVSSPGTRYTRKHLIHGDANVDVLSGMSIPENATSLFGFLGDSPVGASVSRPAEGSFLANSQNLSQNENAEQFGSDAMIYY